MRKIMKRNQIYLPEKQVKMIKKYAYELGISKSEMIRRILDGYIEERRRKALDGA